MKKLLGLLGAAGLVATTSATVVACGTPATASDVTLKSGELSKDFTVKSDKILEGGTVTTELAKDSVLTVVVKADSVKKGEATLTISTTEDKLTDKEVTESIKVLFKAKDAAAEVEATEVATVSVTVKAKTVEAIDLSKVTLTGFTATNETTDAQVLAELQKVEGLSKLAASDITIVKANATTEKAGSIKITATKTSKLVKGELTLEIAKLEAEVTKKDLSKVTLTGFTAKNETTNEQVIAELKKVEGLSEISEANDVTIVKTPATDKAAGNITITAKESSTLVEGTLVLAIAQLTE